MPKLVVHLKDKQEEFPLGTEPVTCGRSSSSQICIPDVMASRDHCRFETENVKWYVIDLKSSNGTQLDGRKISQREELKNGSVVRIGEARISFVDETAAAPVTVIRAIETDFSLKASGGPCDGQTFKITQTITQIGRADDNDIVLDETSVSGRHAELVVEGSVVRIVDTKSRNGVKVNGVHVRERALDPGDRIVIGSTTFEFVGGPAKTAGPVPAPEAGGVDLAGAQGPKDEVVGEPPARSIFTKRVKIIAAVAVLIVAAAFVSDYIIPSGPTVETFPNNLLAENPSFEKGTGTKIPGWTRAKGGASLEEDAPDGEQCLRLTSAPGSGADASALCWSNEISVSAKKTYDLSALIRNSGGESACLCVAWLCKPPPPSKESLWLWNLQLGARTDDAMQWRRVNETLTPPSWATSARFGCAVVGQGAARFDGFHLREAGATAGAPRIAAGRIALEPSPRGEWTVFADGKPIFGRGRAVISVGGRLAIQSLGTLDKGSPQIGARTAKFAGQLGLDGKLPFTEAVSIVGEDLTVHYEFALAGAPNAVIAIEFVSDAGPAGGPPAGPLAEGVTLRTSRGAASVEKAPFPARAEVEAILFYSGDKRIFLRLSEPANVSVRREPNEPLTWRIEFPSARRGERSSIRMIWTPANREKLNLVAADLARAESASRDEEFGKAIKIYEEIKTKYPLYADEVAEADRRLSAVRADIAEKVEGVRRLVSRASRTKAEADYVMAERAAEQLIEKVKGEESSAELSKTLAALKVEYKAAIERSKAREAAEKLDEAKACIQAQQFNIARATLQFVIEKFPDTSYAVEAKKLLATLPPPE